jgi:predicted transcriptional regulator
MGMLSDSESAAISTWLASALHGFLVTHHDRDCWWNH